MPNVVHGKSPGEKKYDLIPTSPILQLKAGRNVKHLLRVLSASSPLQALTKYVFGF